MHTRSSRRPVPSVARSVPVYRTRAAAAQALQAPEGLPPVVPGDLPAPATGHVPDGPAIVAASRHGQPAASPNAAPSIASSASALQREAMMDALGSIQAQLAPLAALPQRVESLQTELLRVQALHARSASVTAATATPLAAHTVANPGPTPNLCTAVRTQSTAPVRVTIPVFDGALGRWEAFWRQFLAVRQLLHWDHETTGQMLLTHLRDAALDAVMALPEPRDDLDRLQAFLALRFGATAALDVCQAQLEGRTRRQGEDLYAFARDVEILARRTYPGSPEELIQREALSVFLNGVSAEAHKRIKYERARTMHDALAIAIQCESYAILRAPLRPVRAAYADETGTSHDVPVPVRQAQTDDRRKRPCPNCDKTGHLFSECRAPPVCFNCKKGGHTRRDCKHPRRDDRRDDRRDNRRDGKQEESKSGNAR